MSNALEQPALPAALVRRSRRISPYWLVPLIAAIIAAWLAWDTLSREGPTITISFEGAEGLQAGQSKLKYRDVTLGTVKSIALNADHTRVTVTVATVRQATPLLTEGTVFWVVKPRLFAGNLSGLETLISGSYIGMVPGNGGSARRAFVGSENPPVLTVAVPGRTFLLKAARLGSITVGAPVIYRDLNVGEVLGWDLGKMAEDVTIHAFVRAPFDSYVNNNSRFWDASGLSVKLGAGGLDVQLESIRALLLGGISFETPPDQTAGAESPENHLFPLFANKEAAMNASYTRQIPFIAYFPGSVRGLVKGSDVLIHGLKVGEVTDVGLHYDEAKQEIVAPVHFTVQPERIVGIGRTPVGDPEVAVDLLVRDGLRATLQSANLLTGGMVVALDFIKDAKPEEVQREGDAFVLPTSESVGLAGIEASASELLRKVNAVPLDKIGADLAQMSDGLNQLVNGPELKQSLSRLNVLLASTQEAVRQLDAGLSPAVKKLPALVADLQKTLNGADTLLASLNSAYGDNTRFSRQVGQSLTQLDDLLRSLQSLSDLLSRNPEALIRGRPGSGTE